MQAIKRSGASQKLQNMIKAIYKETDFYVELDGDRSGTKKQTTGIRQGCPLSPYLFIIALSTMFEDIYRQRMADPYYIDDNIPRANFKDIADFIGWYTTQSEKMVGISKHDYYNQYLAYHEGQGGWKKKTYLQKDWLIEVAKNVERNTKMYNNQLLKCEEKLNKKGLFGIF